MLTLSFDTSAAHCAVALLSGDRVLSERREPMNKGQAERLMVLCEEILAETNEDWRALQVIGVGTGPGNFTGIRIAVSAARGLALALGVPAIGVPVAEAMAFGTQGPVVTSIDARQNKVYAQRLDHATGQSAIALMSVEDMPDAWAAPAPMCIGHRADEIAAYLKGKSGAPAEPIAVAIARIAQGRAGRPQSRPAPLYVRAPDAAPPRDTPPLILTQ